MAEYIKGVTLSGGTRAGFLWGNDGSFGQTMAATAGLSSGVFAFSWIFRAQVGVSGTAGAAHLPSGWKELYGGGVKASIGVLTLPEAGGVTVGAEVLNVGVRLLAQINVPLPIEALTSNNVFVSLHAGYEHNLMTDYKTRPTHMHGFFLSASVNAFRY